MGGQKNEFWKYETVLSNPHFSVIPFFCQNPLFQD